MPIVNNPPRQVGTMIPFAQNNAIAKQRQQGAFNGITEEVVEEVNDDGSYAVVGVSLTTSGVSQPITAGDIVRVGWKGGEPKVILSHTARRAKFVPVLPALANPYVEEIFFDGTQSIWFRNYNQIVKLVDVIPAGTGQIVHWGVGTFDYFCIENMQSSNAAVYKLNRPRPNLPFPPGFKIKATLVKAYSFATDPRTFGSATVTFDAGSPNIATAAGTLSYYTVIVATVTGIGNAALLSTPNYAGITANGQLLVRLAFRASGGAGAESLLDNIGDLLVNADTGEILVSHVPSIYLATIFVPIFCTQLATVSIVFAGPPAGAPGTLELLSLRRRADGTSEINNYALITPAGFGSNTNCGVLTPNTLAIRGEFAQIIEVFPVFVYPIFQASRTRMLYTRQSGGSLIGLRMADFRHKLIADIANPDPDAIFGLGPGQIKTNRPLFCTQGDLTYHPLDLTPPYNRQFFVGGISDTAIEIDQAALTRNPNLQRFATLRPARSATEISAVITNVFTSDLQVVKKETF